MKYSNEFKALLASNGGYIGHGNPNAKILILGQEPAVDPAINVEQYYTEILGNDEQWRLIVSKSIGYNSINHDVIEFGLPLHPWANQKFQVRNKMQNGKIQGVEGTARTWYNYQKLINRIFELSMLCPKHMTKSDYLDFHQRSFHTDMSSWGSHKHGKVYDLARESVLKRLSLLSSDFFRKFPIVIAAVGHFPRDTYGDTYFSDIFHVEYSDSVKLGKLWINVNKNKEKLLIHCPQFSASISNEFINEISQIIVDFAREHNINLIPEE